MTELLGIMANGTSKFETMQIITFIDKLINKLCIPPPSKIIKVYKCPIHDDSLFKKCIAKVS